MLPADLDEDVRRENVALSGCDVKQSSGRRIVDLLTHRVVQAQQLKIRFGKFQLGILAGPVQNMERQPIYHDKSCISFYRQLNNGGE